MSDWIRGLFVCLFAVLIGLRFESGEQGLGVGIGGFERRAFAWLKQCRRMGCGVDLLQGSDGDLRINLRRLQVLVT